MTKKRLKSSLKTGKFVSLSVLHGHRMYNLPIQLGRPANSGHMRDIEKLLQRQMPYQMGVHISDHKHIRYILLGHIGSSSFAASSNELPNRFDN